MIASLSVGRIDAFFAQDNLAPRVVSGGFSAESAMCFMHPWRGTPSGPPDTARKKFAMMGKEFDPAKPAGYLASFAIKHAA